MGNQAGIIIRNVKNELFHSAKRLILNEVKGIECLPSNGVVDANSIIEVALTEATKCIKDWKN